MFSYKRGILILLVLMLVTGASCENPVGEKKDVSIEDKKGIVMSFREGAPPATFYKDISFEVMVELHNKGLLDVNKGNIRLGGLTPQYKGWSEVKPIGHLMGTSNYHFGGTDLFTWSGINIDINYPVRSDDRRKISAKLCYEGSVVAQPEVCIRPRPGGNGIDEDGCDDKKRITYSEGNGGPIAVTAITETVLQAKGKESTHNIINLRIEVENVGDGEIIGLSGTRERLVEKCSFTETDKLKSEVDVEVSWLGGDTLFECKSGINKLNKIVMLDGKGVLNCVSTPVPNNVHYPQHLNIDMNYGYTNSINKAITLKKDVY